MIFSMKRQILLRALTFGISASALVLTSCSTTETRISNHPEIFQTLSPRDQELVRQGKIREGMSQDAVWVAWGTPDQKGTGHRAGPRRGDVDLQRIHLCQRPLSVSVRPIWIRWILRRRPVGVSPSSPPPLRHHWRSFLRSLLLFIHSAKRGVSGQDGHVFQWSRGFDSGSDPAALLIARARGGPCRSIAEARCSGRWPTAHFGNSSTRWKKRVS